MLLSDRDIWVELESGQLSFSPELTVEQIGPASIDLHLDKLAKRFKKPPRGYDEIKPVTSWCKGPCRLRL